MRFENLLNRPLFGFSSPRGLYRWIRSIKQGLSGPSNIPFSKRVSLLSKGFLPIRYNQWGENFLSQPDLYLSDRQYYKGHPYNGSYSMWIDDKMTMRYVFSADRALFPEYFCWIDEMGGVRLLSDYPNELDAAEPVIDVLKAKKVAALKSMVGSCGVGFYKLVLEGDVVFVNNKPYELDDFRRFVSGLKNYLLCEYIVSKKYLRKIYPDSTNTMRVNIMNDGINSPTVISAFIRFGTKKSGSVDNGGAGGLIIPMLIHDGSLLEARSFHKDGTPSYFERHPDSGERFPEAIAEWNEVVSSLIEISKRYPQLSYLGFDVALTDDGFKIIEINSLNDLYSVQLAGGVLAEDTVRAFFKA